METGLLKKLQGRGSKSKPKDEGEIHPSIQDSMATPMTEISSDSVGVSSKLMRRIQEGKGKPKKAKPDLSHLDEEAPVPQGKIKFHAGKRVGSGQQLTLESQTAPSARRGGSISPGWPMILRMMEDIGWDIVLERVRSFVRDLTLTEVAQKFQAPSEDLTETILQSWRDAGLHKEELISSRLQTVPEVATALVVYVNEFQGEK